METLVTTVHFLVAILMIGLILIQQGKGSNMGVSMGGGGSNTVFGSSGGTSFFGKMTALLAFIFFLTSLGLALISRDNAEIGAGSILPTSTLETVAPVAPSVENTPPALPINESVDSVPALPVESAPQIEDGVESAIPVE